MTTIIKKIQDKKAKKQELAKLREMRDSFRDKARECAVYDNAAGYHFWKRSADEISTRIMALNVPEGRRDPRAGMVREFVTEEIKRAYLA